MAASSAVVCRLASSSSACLLAPSANTIASQQFGSTRVLPTTAASQGRCRLVRVTASSEVAAPAAEGGPTAGGAPAGKKVVAGKAVAGKKKVAAKPIVPAMEEDIIPALRAVLDKEEGLLNLELAFTDNVLAGSFLKNDIPYNFWAYFPDGTLDGARGFSLTSCGNLPSTVEPFIIDERKITPELVVFWVSKRLFAQKLLSLN